MSTDKFKFKTKIYDNNEYVLVQDLKILDLHYCSELNTANNMVHELEAKNKQLVVETAILLNGCIEDCQESLREFEIIEAKNKEQEKLLIESRRFFAESVANECKCETNTRVNHDLVNRNLEYKKLLIEACEVMTKFENSIEIRSGYVLEFKRKPLIKELLERKSNNN